MYKHSVNNKPVLGSRQAWIAMRIMEAVVCLSLLVFIPPLTIHSSVFHADGRDFLPFLGIFGALMFAGFAQAHRIVYGFVDAGGIHYHRYLRWKYVSWERIESIAKRPMGTIHVNVEGENFPSRHLVFLKDTVVLGGQSKSVTFDDLRSMWFRARQSHTGSMRNGV
jgi:hypothetical protein